MAATYSEPRVWTKTITVADGATVIQPIPFFNPKLGIHVNWGAGVSAGTLTYTTASMAEIQAGSAIWTNTSIGALSGDVQGVIDNAITAIKVTSTGGITTVTFTQ